MLGSLTLTNSASGFEHTKVLPKGIRNLTIKSISTSIDSKTNHTGKAYPLAQALMQNLTFSKIIKSEKGIKKKQLLALLETEGIQEEESLGQFNADLRANVSVLAPVMSVGVTKNLTLAIAVPYYRAKSGVSLGFEANQENASRFINTLANENYNQVKSAQEVANKLNNPVGELNKKLTNNGFNTLNNWSDEGIGDITIASKALVFDQSQLKIATTNGMVLPTGQTKNPDILNDIPFGKGSIDVFSSIISDQYIYKNIFFNQFAKYTYRLPSEKQMRLATNDESIAVEKGTVSYKIGDQIDSGLSIQFEPESGFLAGVGYQYSMKYGDHYKLSDIDVKHKAEKGTNTSNHQSEIKVGYSTVQAYKRGSVALPFTASLEYKKSLASINSTTNDYIEFDLALFF